MFQGSDINISVGHYELLWKLRYSFVEVLVPEMGTETRDGSGDGGGTGGSGGESTRLSTNYHVGFVGVPHIVEVHPNADIPQWCNVTSALNEPPLVVAESADSLVGRLSRCQLSLPDHLRRMVEPTTKSDPPTSPTSPPPPSVDETINEDPGGPANGETPN